MSPAFRGFFDKFSCKKAHTLKTLNMNHSTVNIDATGLYAELIAIKAVIWSFAEYNIPAGKQWEHFMSIYEKKVAAFAQAFDEAEKNRK